MTPGNENALIPEWNVSEDNQVAIVGVVVAAIMLLGVLGIGGWTIWSAILGDDDASTELVERALDDSSSSDDLDVGAADELAAGQRLDVDFIASGMNVTVRGDVPTASDRDVVLAAAAALDGVGSVTDDLRVIAPDVVAAVSDVAGDVTTSMAGYVAVVDGAVTDGDERAAVLSAAEGVDGVEGVDDRLIVLSDEAMSIASTSNLAVATTVEGRTVTVTGDVPTSIDAARVLGDLGEITGVASVADELRILEPEVVAAATVDRPAIAATMNSYDVDLGGTLADESSRASVVAAVAAVPGVGDINDAMVGVESVLDGVDGEALSAQLDGTEVVLSGVVADLDARQTLVRAAEALPGITGVDDDLTTVNAALDNVELTGLDDVELSRDGRYVTLSGTVATEARRTELVDSVRSIPGVAEVSDELTVAPSPLETALNELVQLDPVQFATGSDVLAPESIEVLDRAIVLLTQSPAGSVTIAGHTDDQGDAAANQALSEARAQTVADYLIAGGVSADRLTVVGVGEADPVEPNDTAEGRAANRRIEFEIS